MRRALVLAVAGLLLLPVAASAKPTITVAAGEMEPVLKSLAQSYVKNHSVRFAFRPDSELGPVADVAAGLADLGAARFERPPGDTTLRYQAVARDPICVVTHKANPITQLSDAQVKAIFGGTVRSWEDVPGSSRTGVIDMSVPGPPGQRRTMQTLWMGAGDFWSGAPGRLDDRTMRISVLTNENAVGLLSWNATRDLHRIGYRGIRCERRNWLSGQYGKVRDLNAITRKGRTSKATRRFIAWAQTSEAARNAVRLSGYKPL